MPKGFKTVAPGILVRESAARLYRGKPDRYFSVRYRVNGSRHQEGLGWASDGWNVEKARAILQDLQMAARRGEGATLKQRREERQSKLASEPARPTLGMVWAAYKSTLQGRVLTNCDGYVKNHLQALMPMLIADLRTHHLDALRRELEGKGLAPATVRHNLSLVRAVIFWGVRHGFNEQPRPHELHFNMPALDNQVTENLTDAQLKTFIEALAVYPDQVLAASMRFALLTGVRRYALFNLRWSDIDFQSKVIRLAGAFAKNGRTEFIPLTPAVEQLLNSLPQDGPGRPGRPNTHTAPAASQQRLSDELIFGQTNFQSRAVKNLIAYVRPCLPEGFRPYHGLRHCYASRLASNGASLYEIQKLLTQADVGVTQRYAHLCADSLRKTAAMMGDILDQAINPSSGRCRTNDKSRRRAKICIFRPTAAIRPYYLKKTSKAAVKSD